MRKLGSFSKEELIKIFKDYPIIYPDNRYGRAKIVAKITMPTQNLIIPPITIWATSGQIDNGEFWVYGLIRCIPNIAHFELINLDEQIRSYGGADYEVEVYGYPPMIASLKNEKDVPEELVKIYADTDYSKYKYGKMEAEYIAANLEILAEETADGEPPYDEEFYGEPCDFSSLEVAQSFNDFRESDSFEAYSTLELKEWYPEEIEERILDFLDTVCRFVQSISNYTDIKLPFELVNLVFNAFACSQTEGTKNQRVVLFYFCESQRELID